MRKLRFATVLFCIAVLGVIGIKDISAYLSDADTVDNVAIIGGNKIEIVEEFIPPSELIPGVVFTKDVKVSNIGSSSCYVRIKAVFTDSDMGRYCEVDWNTSEWEYNSEDGYYYYKYSIAKGETTSSLFTKVTINEYYDYNGDGVLDEDEKISESEMQDFDILIYSESYQSYGFDNYSDAWKHYHRNNPNK